MCEISLISRAQCPCSRQMWPVQRSFGTFRAHTLDYLGQWPAPVQHGTFARAQGNGPPRLKASVLGPPVHSLAARIAKGILLLPMQQS
ncbi:hypothetical protein C8240_15345 [Paracidovorax cattleyae]|nr:hypothetical protein C8240_15345 [Paracidovorax cattleyae]